MTGAVLVCLSLLMDGSSHSSHKNDLQSGLLSALQDAEGDVDHDRPVIKPAHQQSLFGV